ncbi:hypothetical protein F0562_028023 [Nyssa sinensis]|uniref:RNase H type-1 domain-containing protein n=1 Tax=Nyssa sinensis TaxID=561372 RepID=A0A5J5BB48_9ASTE|nr:hypothetical protein F0562_028023 [Nyssa sinensis]
MLGFKEARLGVAYAVPGVMLIGAAKWKGPMKGLYKLNIDGSWCAEQGVGSVGGVIRDWRGSVIGGFGINLGFCCSAVLVEILAFLHGISFAKDIGMLDVAIEYDCLSVLSAVTSSSKTFRLLAIL